MIRSLVAAIAACFLITAVGAAPSKARTQGASIDLELQRALERTKPNSRLDVVLFLSNQPAPQIAEEVRDQFEPTLLRISDEIRIATALILPSRGSLTEAEEKEYLKRVPPTPHAVQIALLEEYDEARNAMIGIVMRRAELAVQRDQQAVKSLIASLGGTSRSSTSVVSAVAATVPAKAVTVLADDPRIAIVALDRPGQPELDISVPTIGAPTGFWANGITGGTFDAGVLDTGVQTNHPAFAGHLFSTSNGGIDTNGHGTAMAGIMASRDATRRGVAYGCEYICAAIAGADSTSMNGMNWLMNTAADRPEAINYSFGNGTANVSDYAPIDQFFDSVIDTFAVMVSKSTGNGGFGTGAPTITHPAPAYNLMATANMNDNNTLARTDDRINSSSSRGPTVSGRKKPDITAPGTNIVSPTPAGGWTGVTGTSPAAPHVGGSVLLMMHRGILDPFAAKAVLINGADAIDDLGTSSTTDDVWVNGSLWNRRYGWGYLDLAESYVHSLDVFVRTFQAPPAGGRRFRFFKGNMLANEKSTLTWNRHATYNGATYPTIVRALSNLDLQCWSQSSGALAVQSASTIDNVEQLSVSSNLSVVLKVLTVGNFDPNVTQERFALATEENFVEAVGPTLIVLPPNGEFEYAAGSQANVTVRVRNDGDLPAFNVMVGISNLSIISPANPQNVGTIQPGQTVQASWLVQLPNVSAEMVVGGSASSSSFGETFNGAASGFIVVGNESFLTRWLR